MIAMMKAVLIGQVKQVTLQAVAETTTHRGDKN